MDRKGMEELRDLLPNYLQQRGISLCRPFRCLSPDHEDRHPSMSYNARAQNVHCFACGITYDIFDLVGMDYTLTEFPEQLRKVCDLFDVMAVPVLYPKSVGAGLQVNRDNRTGSCSVRSDRSLELEKIRLGAVSDPTYFITRGINSESIERFGLFEADGRAWFPFFEQNTITGWCARAIDSRLQPRYLNSPGPLGIWNADRLSEPGNGRRMFVTEGVIDAICLEQLGYAAVSICGSQNTGKLVRYAFQYPEITNSWRFVLCGDADEAGYRMNSILKKELSALGLSVTVLDLKNDTVSDIFDNVQGLEKKSAVNDINDLYLRDKHLLEQLLREEDQGVVYAAGSAAASLDGFFLELNRRKREGLVKTGFTALDRILGGGLHAGLYVLGAISSLGKTSLVLQMADYIAANDRDVLFITLEQSRHELMAKSISRTAFELCGESTDCFSAGRLLGGQITPDGTDKLSGLLREAVQVYAATATGLFFREGIADIGSDEVRKAIMEHMTARGRAPVVIIDYMQILRPQNSRATDKQNMDRNVVELRRISRDFDIPVIAVSSFNRENYRTAVSMEAFKESGAVEYSADVLLGLQPAGAGTRDFDVNTAKLESPRRLELVVLKNRNGIPWAKIPLLYEARFGLFREGTARVRRMADTNAG